MRLCVHLPSPHWMCVWIEFVWVLCALSQLLCLQIRGCPAIPRKQFPNPPPRCLDPSAVPEARSILSHLVHLMTPLKRAVAGSILNVGRWMQSLCNLPPITVAESAFQPGSPTSTAVPPVLGSGSAQGFWSSGLLALTPHCPLPGQPE